MLPGHMIPLASWTKKLTSIPKIACHQRMGPRQWIIFEDSDIFHILALYWNLILRTINSRFWSMPPPHLCTQGGHKWEIFFWGGLRCLRISTFSALVGLLAPFSGLEVLANFLCAVGVGICREPCTTFWGLGVHSEFKVLTKKHVY